MSVRVVLFALSALLLASCDDATESPALGDNANKPSTSVQRTSDEVPVTLRLFHCGIELVTVDGRDWEAVGPHPDLTNAPDTWIGEGTALVQGDKMIYTDQSGQIVEFVAGTPEPCF